MKPFFWACAAILSVVFAMLLWDNHNDAVRYVNALEVKCLSEGETPALCLCLKDKMYPEKAAWVPSTATHWSAQSVTEMMMRRCKKGV